MINYGKADKMPIIIKNKNIFNYMFLKCLIFIFVVFVNEKTVLFLIKHLYCALFKEVML